MEQREGKTGREGRGSSRRAPLSPAKSVLPCPGAGVADGHGTPSPARSRLVMLPKVETEALGLARSNGEQGQMPENMQGKGGDAGRSPSAHARVSLGKAPLRPAKKVCGSCLRAAPSPPAPRPAEPLPWRDSFRGGSSGYRGPGCQGRGDDKALLGRCKRGRGAARHPAGASLPAGADVPSDPARPRCRSKGSRSSPRSAQKCLEVYGRWSYAWKFWRAPRVSHTAPKRDPRALSRGCGAHRYRAGGRGGVAKFSRKELRLRGGFAGYPERQRDARAGMELEMSMCGGGTGLFPVPHSGRERCAEGGGADLAEGRLPALEPAARYDALPGRNSRPGCSLEIIPSPLGSLLGRSRGRVGRGLRRC